MFGYGSVTFPLVGWILLLVILFRYFLSLRLTPINLISQLGRKLVSKRSTKLISLSNKKLMNALE